MLRPEQQLQQVVASYLDAAYPQLLWWHTPNSSGNRGQRLGGILRSMGVKSGVPDICIIMPDGRAAFIELKAGRGRLTDTQEAFRKRATSCDAFWAEARSLDEVADLVERWLLPFGWRARARAA